MSLMNVRMGSECSLPHRANDDGLFRRCEFDRIWSIDSSPTANGIAEGCNSPDAFESGRLCQKIAKQRSCWAKHCFGICRLAAMARPHVLRATGMQVLTRGS